MLKISENSKCLRLHDSVKMLKYNKELPIKRFSYIMMIRFEIHEHTLPSQMLFANYIEEKIGKLERYFNDVPNAVAHVKVKTYSNSATKIEVTIPLKKCYVKS